MFRLERATKTYDGQRALGPLTLDIAADRTTVLIGPSGCGKSTLLKLLIGLVAPDEGSVYAHGTVVSGDHLLRLRRDVGYVIQDGGLFPHLTARQNVTIMAEHLGWRSAEIDARVRELVALTHFPSDALDRYPRELSGGQNQRVGLMRALMLDPAALLLDEPLGALDPMIRYELQIELAQIFRRLRKTVVLVTHDLAEAGCFADHVVLLRDGRIAQQGTFEALIETPASDFVSRFTLAQRAGAEASAGRAP